MYTMQRKFLVFFLLTIFSLSYLSAQHCSDATVADNGASAKIRDGGGFSASYSFPCVNRGVYTEIEVPFKVFNTVPRGNSDDQVYKMRIDKISNLPDGMCWVTNKVDNVFQKGEGGLLVLRGITNDATGQFNLSITVSFDTEGQGVFNRADVNYNKVSSTGRMILRVNEPGAECPEIDYDLQSNIAGTVSNTAYKQ